MKKILKIAIPVTIAVVIAVLLLVFLLVASVVSAVLVLARGIKNCRHIIKRRPPVPPHRPSFDDDIDIPF